MSMDSMVCDRIIFLSLGTAFDCALSNPIENLDRNPVNEELTMIAGSIVMSDSPPQQLKYWRKKFGIKQADLAKRMAITPSVLSDYEKGRRPSPGVNFIRKYLVALYGLSKKEPEHEPVPLQHEAPTISGAVHINSTASQLS